MKINGLEIADIILNDCKKRIKSLKLKTPLRLTVFTINPTLEIQTFVTNKGKRATKLGIDFDIQKYSKIPTFARFAKRIIKHAEDPQVTGIIIQKPLPAELSTISLYNYMPPIKDIEGSTQKSPHISPLGKAVLTILKYIYNPGDKKSAENILIDLDRDTSMFKNILRRKKIVLVGRGETGGKPIGDALTKARINFINVNSITPNPVSFYKEADIIISAVGHNVIDRNMVKSNVILIGAGITHENGYWIGDYNEKDIQDIASFYTPTTGGLGPINIAYLMSNLIDAYAYSVSQSE